MYGDLDGVSALVPAVGAFSGSSTPTDAQVYTWLDEATVIINGALSVAGYGTTIDEDAAILPWLDGMVELYAAATAIQARGLDSSSGGDENKSEQMFRRFYAQLKLLGGSNLDALGLTIIAWATGNPRFRTTQLRRIDGYSATYEGSASPYSYPSE